MAEDTITRLPDEVVELILENESITIREIVDVALSCKQLHRTVFTSNKLWRSKFFQRWPFLKEAYKTEDKLNQVQNWIEEVKSSINSRKELMRELSRMSAKNYKEQELSHTRFQDFDVLFRPKLGAHSMSYHFLVDELISIIEQPPMEGNLTHKYYAYKVIRYLRQTYLTDVWNEFIALPPEEQTLEKGATIVAQWSQPERRVSYVHITEMLDNIAEQTKDMLREQNPSHPIFSATPAQLESWKKLNIDDNQWSGTDSRQILSALCYVMFNKLGFHWKSEMYYSSKNSFIDRVLKSRGGIPITLDIIFESVSRRLGVRCEPVSFPAHFLLQWKEKYTGPNADDYESFYIDVINGGDFLTKNNCPRVGKERRCPIDRYNRHSGATAVEVVERMAKNLEIAGRQRTHLNGRSSRLRSALEFLHMVQPHDPPYISHLARFYMLHHMDVTKLVNILLYLQQGPELLSRGPATHTLHMLQNYTENMTCDNTEVEVKLRVPKVEYAIGMIMKHRGYDYLCVIAGWDYQCEASPEWMSEMSVDELSKGSNQPFYNVFTGDGSSRYVAQENLIIAPEPGWVNHYEIGRYFREFKGTHYLPNEEKAKEYPEDIAELQRRLFSEP